MGKTLCAARAIAFAAVGGRTHTAIQLTDYRFRPWWSRLFAWGIGETTGTSDTVGGSIHVRVAYGRADTAAGFATRGCGAADQQGSV